MVLIYRHPYMNGIDKLVVCTECDAVLGNVRVAHGMAAGVIYFCREEEGKESCFTKWRKRLQ